MQRFISFLFRPSQRNGIPRLFLPIGVVVASVAAVGLSGHNTLMWLLIGLGQTALGGADYLPVSQRIMSGILRLAGLVLLIVAMCFSIVT